MNTTEAYNAVQDAIQKNLEQYVGKPVSTETVNSITKTSLLTLQKFFPNGKISVSVNGPKITANIELDVVTLKVYGPEIK